MAEKNLPMNYHNTKRNLKGNVEKTYSFHIMDFEFFRWHNQKIIFVSGAISSYQATENIVKLQGHPLVLDRESNITKLSMKDRNSLIMFTSKIFRNKPSVLEPFLKELHLSFSAPKHSSNLNSESILNHMNKTGKQPVIVLWNGTNDTDILYRLKISAPIILNITSYNDYGDDQFFLKMFNLDNGKILFNQEIGFMKKNGRQLSLGEAHSIICNVNHQIKTYVHDPVVDVLYTQCIFDYIVKNKGYNNIFKATTE